MSWCVVLTHESSPCVKTLLDISFGFFTSDITKTTLLISPVNFSISWYKFVTNWTFNIKRSCQHCLHACRTCRIFSRSRWCDRFPLWWLPFGIVILKPNFIARYNMFNEIIFYPLVLPNFGKLPVDEFFDFMITLWNHFWTNSSQV